MPGERAQRLERIIEAGHLVALAVERIASREIFLCPLQEYLFLLLCS
jgi:hypothetical protein